MEAFSRPMHALFARRSLLVLLAVSVALGISACGGGNDLTKPPPHAGCPKDMARVPGKGGTGGGAFCLDRTEVTVSAYADCIGKAQCTAAAPGRECNADTPLNQMQPINCVDWSQANDFCHAMGKRLPLEDEWETAANAQDPGGSVCWSGSRPLGGTCAVDRPGAQSSQQGIVDLNGNVAEWTGSGTSEARVIRGGFWSANDPAVLRSDSRRTARATDRSNAVGFRCARDM
jgi:formylglycine-generating enzyme required for sulfatase activity